LSINSDLRIIQRFFVGFVALVCPLRCKGKFKEMSVETAPLLTEINKKIALAFAPLIFILFGLPLAIMTKRREKRVNFIMAFFVVLVYYLLSLGAEAVGMQNILPPAVVMWIPNMIFGGLGILLTYRLCVS